MSNIFKCLLVFSLFIFTSNLFGQKKFSISGYLKDESNGESLIGATVSVADTTGRGTATNVYGFYSLSLPEGKYIINFSYVGFATIAKEVILDHDLELNLAMGAGATLMEEFVVTQERLDKNVSSTEMGTEELTTDRIKSIPAFMGEVDIIKALQLLPGVQAAGEGNSGLYVRGGGPDQNLVLLDDAIVYNTGHLFGFFSVFNADAVKSTTLIKGGMPASYGGRISSVIDISMKEGNNKKFAFEGGIGLISSRFTLEGPIKKDKSSFLISARRTYAFDLAQPLIKKTDFAGTNYNFYDLNLKWNYIFSQKDRLFVSGYFGRDVFVYNSNKNATSIKIPWGNATSTVRWNHLFNDKLFMNTLFVFNNYKFKFQGAQEDFSFEANSGVRDFNLKFAFDYFANPKHQIKFGYDYTFHTFTPTTASAKSGETSFESNQSKKHAHEMALYVSDEWDISTRVKLDYGIRLSLFQHTGPFTEYVGGAIAPDTIVTPVLQPLKTYAFPEPRFALRVGIDDQSSFKTGLTANAQYVHLVSSSNSTLPTDVWVPSTRNVKPQLGLQYSAGYFRNFKDNTYETSVEVYYKEMWNQIEFGDSYVQELNEDIEKGYVFGRGRSYGLELFVKKRVGKINGWVGYTWSKTTRQFDNLNEGKTFSARFDRTHDVSVNLVYDINKHWSLGATWVFATGNAFTLPTERYFIEFGIVTGYGERNAYRMPSYHRMDFSVTWKPNLKPQKRFKSSYNFSIYNVYNRKNTYFIYYKVEGDVITGDLTTKAIKVSIFPIIPSITWNFKF
ncbi:MAG: TonB-dependent receptor [Bacteroidetes bacterium]|nr:TonB-dependent receptor [Bacteroidota bacterium]MBP7256198.1 TonB-dependent receptor [Chitinophagales bacterium]